MIIAVLQDIDTTSVKTVLGSVIGILIVFIGAMYMYFKNEVKIYRDQLKEERAYIKSEGTKNITALVENNKVLERLVDETSKTKEDVSSIKTISETTQPIIEKNSERITTIARNLKT